MINPVSPGAAAALTAGMRAAQERAIDVVVVELTRRGAAASATAGDVEALTVELGVRFPSVRTSMITYFGHARTALERFSSTAQLVVMRDHRTLWPPQHGIGRTALSHTRCAVSVVPEPAASPTGIDRFLAVARVEADRLFSRPDRRHRAALGQGSPRRCPNAPAAPIKADSRNVTVMRPYRAIPTAVPVISAAAGSATSTLMVFSGTEHPPPATASRHTGSSPAQAIKSRRVQRISFKPPTRAGMN
ncbi:hypothetical protein [Nocardia sp. NPDC003979]